MKPVSGCVKLIAWNQCLLSVPAMPVGSASHKTFTDTPQNCPKQKCSQYRHAQCGCTDCSQYRHAQCGCTHFCPSLRLKAHAMAQGEALRYKPEGRGFDSRKCHWILSVTQSFLPHNGPGVDSASNRNEYQEYFLGW
jgi:hypothetical protein